MPFTTACPNCSARLQVPDNLAGKRVRCKKCSEPFLVEAPAEDDEAETPAPAKARSRPQDDDERPSKRSRPADDEGEADEEEEDRPARKKKKKKKPQGVPPLVIGLVLGGVILVGGGIGAFFLLKDDKKPDSELAAAKGKGETESGPPWFEHVDAEGKYRIKFPSQPQVQTQNVQTPTGNQSIKVAMLPRGPTNFIANASPLPAGAKGDPEQVLDMTVNQVAGQIPGGTVSNKTSITHQGKPGRELTVTAQGGTGVFRIFYANDRIYTIGVFGQPGTTNQPVVKTFFDSLQFD
jgi:predicted Zn finger-like uncharacterized protein